MRRAASPATNLQFTQKKRAELFAQLDALKRTSPRTSGKKAAKTRALKALQRSISATDGAITKAKNKLAAQEAFRKRSEAAKNGYAKSKARKAASRNMATRKVSRMPFLTRDGIVQVHLDTGDASKVGTFWNHVGAGISLEGFHGDSVLDVVSGKRYDFVTDADIVDEHSYDFDGDRWPDSISEKRTVKVAA